MLRRFHSNARITTLKRFLDIKIESQTSGKNIRSDCWLEALRNRYHKWSYEIKRINKKILNDYCCWKKAAKNLKKGIKNNENITF